MWPGVSEGRGSAWLPIPAGELAERVGGLTVATNVLADTVGGAALAAYRGRGYGGPTIELCLDHVAAPSGAATVLVAEAEVLHEVGGAACLAGEVRDNTGVVVARISGHFPLLSNGAPGRPRPVPGRLAVAARLGMAVRLGPALGVRPGGADVTPGREMRARTHGMVARASGTWARIAVAPMPTGCWACSAPPTPSHRRGPWPRPGRLPTRAATPTGECC